MTFVGSKARYAKYLVPIIQKCIDDNAISTYVEPFVGGANIIQKIDCKNKIGNDVHSELIAMFKQVQNGWDFPMHISEEEYKEVQHNKEKYPDYYLGLVGYCASFGTKYFNGYARYRGNGNAPPRDCPNERLRRLRAEALLLKNIQFINNDFSLLDFEDSVIYCDPPYSGVENYYSNKKFDHQKYWNWVREQSGKNIVLCSEYVAPDDFVEIWSLETTSHLNKDFHVKKCEKLFVYSEGKYAKLYLE